MSRVFLPLDERLCPFFEITSYLFFPAFNHCTAQVLHWLMISLQDKKSNAKLTDKEVDEKEEDSEEEESEEEGESGEDESDEESEDEDEEESEEDESVEEDEVAASLTAKGKVQFACECLHAFLDVNFVDYKTLEGVS